jgi:hypothetical protein
MTNHPAVAGAPSGQARDAVHLVWAASGFGFLAGAAP